MTGKRRELDELAEEYFKYGRSTSVVVLVLLGFFVLPFLMILPRSVLFLHEVFAALHHMPQAAVTTAYVGLYGAVLGSVTAMLAIVALMAGPLFMFLLAVFLKQRTHYRFCKLATFYLSYYRPNRPRLVERTRYLLEQESIRNSFRN